MGDDILRRLGVPAVAVAIITVLTSCGDNNNQRAPGSGTAVPASQTSQNTTTPEGIRQHNQNVILKHQSLQGFLEDTQIPDAMQSPPDGSGRRIYTLKFQHGDGDYGNFTGHICGKDGEIYTINKGMPIEMFEEIQKIFVLIAHQVHHKNEDEARKIANANGFQIRIQTSWGNHEVILTREIPPNPRDEANDAGAIAILKYTFIELPG